MDSREGETCLNRLPFLHSRLEQISTSNHNEPMQIVMLCHCQFCFGSVRQFCFGSVHIKFYNLQTSKKKKKKSSITCTLLGFCQAFVNFLIFNTYYPLTLCSKHHLSGTHYDTQQLCNIVGWKDLDTTYPCAKFQLHQIILTP